MMWGRGNATVDGASRRSRRRTPLGLLALAVVALTLPTAASAIHDAKPPKPPKPPNYKVLVVTSGSKTSALNQAGVNAIKAIGRDDGTKADPNAKFSVELAQDANQINDRFTAQKLERYRAVVFLNTGVASPLTDAQRAAFEDVLPQGRRLRRHRLGDRDRPAWQFLTDILGTRSSGRTDVAVGARSRSPTASTTRRKNLPRVLGPHRHLVQLHDERPRRLARARHGRRGSVRPAAAGPDARRHRRRHDGRRPPGLLVQGLQGRPLVLHRPRQHRRELRRRRSTTHLKGAIDWAAGVSDPVYSDCGATVLANYQQIEDQRAAEPAASRSASTSSRTAGSSRPRAAARVRLHNPATGTTQVLAELRATRACRRRMRLYTNSEDGLYGPAVDNNFATEQLGLPLLLAADGHGRQAVGRLDRHADDAEHDRRRTRRRRRRRGIRTSATSSSRASSSSRTRQAARAPRPELRAADPAGLQQPPGVLPRRGRHRLRQAQQPVDGHG